MNKALFILLLSLFGLKAEGQDFNTLGEIQYHIIKSKSGARKVEPGNILLCGIKTTAKRQGLPDSVIFDTRGNDKPFYLSADDPAFKSLFYLLKQGDSIAFFIPADSMYSKSFSMETPPSLRGASLYFNLQLVKALTPAEMQEEMNRINEHKVKEDSIAFARFARKMKGAKSTRGGVKYVRLKASEGTKVQNGSTVQVHYKGWIVNGDVFDENKDGDVPFEYQVGSGRVIAGWEEALPLMKEGETFRLLIPWRLAYGPKGRGPIPPYSSLVFDVSVVKVKP